MAPGARRLDTLAWLHPRISLPAVTPVPENLRGVRALHRVRVAAGLLFSIVTLITGPILGIDPPGLSLRLLALAAVEILTASMVLREDLRGQLQPTALQATLVITVDMAVVTTVGVMLGGVHSTLPLLYAVVITAHGLCLEVVPLVIAVVWACLGYEILAWTDASPPPLDDQLVTLASYAILGMAASGSVRVARGLVHLALERQRAHLETERSVARYFSPQVREVLLQRPGELLASQHREVTALFADLSGFTALGEEAADVDVIETLDAYLGTLSDVAIQRDGTVDNYLGDGMLVIFNAPLDQPGHARRAIDTAIAMQQAARELSRDRRRRARPALGLTIGINTGPAVAGPIGGEARLQYTVIGDSVNVASRLQAEGSPGDIVIGEAAALQAGLVGELEQAELRGRLQPVSFVRLRAGLLRPEPAHGQA